MLTARLRDRRANFAVRANLAELTHVEVRRRAEPRRPQTWPRPSPGRAERREIRRTIASNFAELEEVLGARPARSTLASYGWGRPGLLLSIVVAPVLVAVLVLAVIAHLAGGTLTTSLPIVPLLAVTTYLEYRRARSRRADELDDAFRVLTSNELPLPFALDRLPSATYTRLLKRSPIGQLPVPVLSHLGIGAPEARRRYETTNGPLSEPVAHLVDGLYPEWWGTFDALVEDARLVATSSDDELPGVRLPYAPIGKAATARAAASSSGNVPVQSK